MLTSTRTPPEPHRETVVAVTTDARGRMRCTTRTGLLAPRLVGSGPDGRLRIALVATHATLLGGDTVTVRLEVGDGCRVELVDVAGTVAYDGRGASAHWNLEIQVGRAGVLCWNAAPLVASAGARIVRRTNVKIAEDGALLLRDILVLGRTGQEPGAIDCRTRMVVGDRPTLAEDLSLDAAAGAAPGMIGDARILDTVTAIGWRPRPYDGVAALGLATPGALARELVRAAHTSRCEQVYRAWESEVLTTTAEVPAGAGGSPPPRAVTALASGSS